MLLIVSEEFDEITNRVIDRLHRMGKCHLRINTETSVDSIFYNISTKNGSGFRLGTNNCGIELSDVSSFWFRRGALMPDLSYNFTLENKQLQNEVANTLAFEWKSLSHHLIKLVEKKYIGNYDLRLPNKLNVLATARKNGLEIPDTLITTSLADLKKYKETHKNIITKPIGEIFRYVDPEQAFVSRTETIEDNYIEKLPQKFFPMLFQENLRKQCEIRVFFIYDCFYAMCIFSQDNTETQNDYRNCSDKVNRLVPFKLPLPLLDKCRNLVADLGLNTGSNDLIYTTEKRFVFLEVNPEGQFDVLSEVCNYSLDKEIANFLTD